MASASPSSQPRDEADPEARSPLAANRAPEESGVVRTARRFYRAYRNSRIRPLHSLLRHLLRRVVGPRHRVTLRSGLRMELDLGQGIQSTIFWYDGDVEPQLTWALREFVPLGGWMIDCGANCGLFGLEARLHRGAHVFLIEPHPVLAEQVRRNIELNGWSDACRVIQAAASDQAGRAELHLCGTNDGSHSLDADWPILATGPSATIEVNRITLAEMLRGDIPSGRVDFLKIDTEGHDLSVLAGLGDDLRPERVAMLYLELGNHREKAIGLLRSRGYAGFSYRHDLLDGVALRRAMRRAADGAPPCLYTPIESSPATDGETLWCGVGSPAERRLLEIKDRS